MGNWPISSERERERERMCARWGNEKKVMTRCNAWSLIRHWFQQTGFKGHLGINNGKINMDKELKEKLCWNKGWKLFIKRKKKASYKSSSFTTSFWCKRKAYIYVHIHAQKKTYKDNSGNLWRKERERGGGRCLLAFLYFFESLGRTTRHVGF